MSELLQAFCALVFFNVVIWVSAILASRRKPKKPRGKRIIMNPAREDLFYFLEGDK